MPPKKRVVNTTVAAPKSVLNPKHPFVVSDVLTFDFSYTNWLRSVSSRNFTNMLKDPNQFGQFIIYTFTKIIPTVQTNWSTIRKNGAVYQFPHCHTISGEKIESIKAVIHEIHGKELCDDVASGELNYWQLGMTQSLRVIAIYSHINNTMYPIFLDYHHQIYPSIKHNDDDIDAYDFCPITSYM